jgi:hypothetical protein
MPWPAFYNGYPLLDPDSMSYLEDGPLVARAVFLHKFSANYGGNRDANEMDFGRTERTWAPLGQPNWLGRRNEAG